MKDHFGIDGKSKQPSPHPNFDKDGFALWPETIDASLLARLKAAVHDIQISVTSIAPEKRTLLLLERELPSGRRGGIPANDVGEAIFLITDPCIFDPVFDEVLHQPMIMRMARELLKTDKCIAHFMNVTIKNNIFGRGIGWHRDFPNTLYCTEKSGFFRIMICLDGMTEFMGATSFIAGSHDITDEAAIIQKNEGSWPQPLEGDGINIYCNPGQIIAIHPKVLHGGGMNTSPSPRRNIVLQIGRAEASLITSERESITGRII